MTTTSETVLIALQALITSATTAIVRRNYPIPTEVGTLGLAILQDGEPGEPAVTLSPLLYEFEHVAAVEIYAQGANRDALFDAIKSAIGAAIVADRTLGGLCDWVEAQAPEATALPVEGGASIKAAIIPIMLAYTTTDPLN